MRTAKTEHQRPQSNGIFIVSYKVIKEIEFSTYHHMLLGNTLNAETNYWKNE